jgi:hypothetical protein
MHPCSAYQREYVKLIITPVKSMYVIFMLNSLNNFFHKVMVELDVSQDDIDCFDNFFRRRQQKLNYTPKMKVKKPFSFNFGCPLIYKVSSTNKMQLIFKLLGLDIWHGSNHQTGKFSLDYCSVIGYGRQQSS